MNNPWYSDPFERLIEATEFFYGACGKTFARDSNFDEFEASFQKEMTSKFIFESNRIEGEGLSEGETRKIVLSEMEKKFPDLLKDFDRAKLSVFLKSKTANNEEKPALGLAVDYKDKKHELNAVMYHLLALKDVIIQVLTVRSYQWEELNKYIEKLGDDKTNIRAFLSIPKYFQVWAATRDHTSKVMLLDENFLKSLHAKIAENSDNNQNGLPGEYRPEPAQIDDETIFIEPPLIESSVKAMIQKHHARLKSEFYNPIIEACRIKEEFIKIHPFGDFNGRISRLLLSGFLNSEGYPFLLTLRSSKSEKKKYLTAMKHAFRGNPLTLISLVSFQIIEQVKAVNERLGMAGLEKISPVRIADDYKKMIKDELDKYRKEIANMKI